LLKISAKTEQASQPRLRKLGLTGIPDHILDRVWPSLPSDVDAVLKQFAGKIEGKWPRPVASI
jgi:hypothetical protein